MQQNFSRELKTVLESTVWLKKSIEAFRSDNFRTPTSKGELESIRSIERRIARLRTSHRSAAASPVSVSSSKRTPPPRLYAKRLFRTKPLTETLAELSHMRKASKAGHRHTFLKQHGESFLDQVAVEQHFLSRRRTPKRFLIKAAR